MEKRTLYIIIAIVLVAALVLTFYGNLTGMSGLGACIDSDGGDNPHTAGTAYHEERASILYKDECYSTGGSGIKKWLKEHYCLEGVETNRYFCENGCLENAKGEGYCAEGEARILAD